MIEGVTAYQALPGVEVGQTQSTPVGDFASWFGSEITKANSALNLAEVQLKKLAAGEQIPIHEVMLSIEEARLSFHLVAQVRNKILDSYQDLMKMQI